MNLRITICAIFLVCLMHTTNPHTLRNQRQTSRHVPAYGVPSFRRDSVESLPMFDQFSDRSASYRQDFGSTFLPLRAAVESIPDVTASARRLPLRDAVEKRLLPDLIGNDIDFERSAFTEKKEQPLNHKKNFLYFEHPKETQYTRTPSPLQRFQSLVSSYSYALPYRVDNGFQQLFIQPGYPPRFTRGLYSQNTYLRLDSYVDKEKKLVCYIDNKGVYRKQPLNFSPDNLDPFACTHIIYAFAQIDPHTYQIMAKDEEYDAVRGGYRSVTGLKRINPDLKVLISVGGLREEGANRFTRMISSATRRRQFIKSLIAFIKQYDFDGVDLHWLYPGAEEFGGQPNDKEYLSLLLEELSELFRPKNWLVVVSVSGSRFRIEDGYNVQKLASFADFINVQAYDYHKERDPVADHPAPLMARPQDNDLDLFNNVDYSIKYWLRKGVPREKIVLGIPFFGRSFTLQSVNQTFTGAPIRGTGREGYYTQRPGFLSYFEICDMVLNEGWRKEVDPSGAPYVVNGDQWIGYEDPDSIEQKMRFVQELELGGAYAWAADLDDFRGLCGEKWPLLTAMKRAISGAAAPGGKCQDGSYAPYPGDCTKYLSCLWGEYQENLCAPGLHWNNKNNICDWPDNAKCDGGGEPPVTNDPSDPDPPTTSKPTTTTTEAPEEPLDPNSGYFKIVCYFTNWAWYRRGVGKYLPENINPDLCTHIVYGFAVLDYENLVIKPHDTWADFDNKFYERVTAVRKKGVKVTIAIGGWNDSQGDKYSRLVNNPSARARFIKHVMEFMEKHNFDGLDLDWEYPKCWQNNCPQGPDSDKPAFASFVRELKAAFKPKGYLLSAAVSASKLVIDAGYDVPALAESLDWVAVMAYDYHGQWDKKTGHSSPLYVHPDDEVVYFNTNYSINYWISQGVPRRKVVMGMPLYGQSFTLENAANNGLNANAPGPGQQGEYTASAGFLAYYEICDRIKNRGWKVIQDPKRRMGPIATSGNQWVGFDDKEMIRIKTDYIRKMDLGGGMIWALDLDDFNNQCGEGKHPLLRTIRQGLAAPGNGGQEGMENSEEEVQPSVDPPQVEPTTLQPQPAQSTTPALVNGDSEYKVVCYFTNWAWYRQGNGKYLPSDIDPDLCTHIIYGFAVLNGDQSIIKPHDSWADLDNKFYEKVTAFKAKGIKVLVAIGGWNDSAGDKYSKLVNNPSARRRFITHVVEFIKQHNFDGLDLDWEYPKCWQVDCNKGPSSDKPAFATFVQELREAFQPYGWLLSAAVSPSKRVIDAGYDVPALSKYLDWIAVMCYDYHGQWDKVTGHVAPMYPHPEDIDVTFNTNFTIHYWIEKGADPKKLVMGMPTYGQSFSLADNSNNGLNAPTYGGGEAGDQTRARGFLSYYEICQNVVNRGWTVVRDPKGRIGPYAYQRDQWVSFDDRDMIRHKSEYIKAMGLGGGMIWALDLDDFKDLCSCETYPLLKTINRVLRGYSKPAPSCQLGQQQPRPTAYPQPATTERAYTTAEPEAGLECRGRQFEAHPTDCNAYYLCDHGMLTVQHCPSGLFWNKDHCDWPENTECHPDHTTTESNEITPPTVTTTTLAPVPGTTPQRPRPPAKDGLKVVCYFTNWAWYRQGTGKFLPSDIDPDLCTHITYGFAVLDENTLTLKPHDTWADIDNDFYKKVIALQAKGIKVSIALGGWNDSAGPKYSRLANDAAARAKFIRETVQFILNWGFDGLDLDWEYPKCWQVECDAGPESDKPAFAQLVSELRQAFNPHGLLLSAAVSPSKAVIDAGYDVPSLSRDFDWIAVMCYDYHGQWDKKTGHVAPLYYYPGDTYDTFNSNYTLNYWIQKGADPKKLIMGMPMYGQSFSLADASNHGLNAPAYGPGQAGEYTSVGGFLSFYEICERVRRRSWTPVRDPEGRIGPYAYSGNQWVGYDDIADIKRKSQYIQSNGLGGGMVWALDLDDFRNLCGCGRSPLLRMMNHVLRGLALESNLEHCA